MTGDKVWLMAMDLSTPRGVLVLDGPDGALQREVPGAARVSQLFVAADELTSSAGISPAELGLIGVGRGPGSFTGVRVAVTAAKVLASVLDVPLVAPDSLMVIAAGAGEKGEVVYAAIDARRGEVYHALYLLGEDIPAVLMGPGVDSPELAASNIRDWMEREDRDAIGAGNGIDAYPDVWPEGMSRTGGDHPHVESLVRLCRLAHGRGEIVDPMALLPLYLRRPDARERCGGDKGAGSC
jgi:tRNA threonylcarbamoyladenosine biosynthesis protein TsaB